MLATRHAGLLLDEGAKERLLVVESGGLQASTVLVVPAGAAGGGQGKGGDLASTGGGDGSIPLARLGVILVASGGVALYAGKKRQGRRAAFVNA